MGVTVKASVPQRRGAMTRSGEIIPSVKPDLPAREDFLGFAPYAQTLFDIVRDEHTQTPLTIGIFDP